LRRMSLARSKTASLAVTARASTCECVGSWYLRMLVTGFSFLSAAASARAGPGCSIAVCAVSRPHGGRVSCPDVNGQRFLSRDGPVAPRLTEAVSDDGPLEVG